MLLVLTAHCAAAGEALAQTTSTITAPASTTTTSITTPASTTTTSSSTPSGSGSGSVISFGSTGRAVFIVVIVGLFAAVLFGLILYDRITVNKRLNELLPGVLADFKPHAGDRAPSADTIRGLIRAVSSPRGAQGGTRHAPRAWPPHAGWPSANSLAGWQSGPAASDPLKGLITALAAALTTVLGFYFGAKTANDAAEAATTATTRGPGTAVTVPDPPTGVGGTPGDGEAEVAFTVPSNTGGSPIAGYTVTSKPDNVKAQGVTSPIVVAGLQNGITYTFTVHATNIVGDSKESEVSEPVTPATPPEAPTLTNVTVSAHEAEIAFIAPSSTGGAPITGYTATAAPSGATASGAASPIVVTELQTGVEYTFTVHATNAMGDGPESAPSNSVTPQ